MYKIYCDGEILYHPNIEEMDIVSGEIDKEANVADSFSFSLMASHPFINKINRMKSVIEVKKGKKIIFRGRDVCEDGDFYNTCEFICEGAYAYFNDTVIMPFEFSGRPDELLTKLVEEHNAQVGEEKKFIVGECTVTDPNDYIVRSSEKAMQTIDCIKEKLTESSLGGYIRIRYEADGNYIDYIDDGNILCNQAIEFGKNLIDLNRTSMYTDIVTSVVPFGSEDENGKNIDVSSVNNGSLVVDDEELIEKYGLIRRPMYWDDVAQPENLLEKAKQFLKGMDYNQDHVVFNALDLSHIDKTVNEYDIYDYVPVKSKPHGIVKNAFCSVQHIDIKNPGQDYMEVGLNIESNRRQQSEKFKEFGQIVERVEKVESNAKINEGAVAEVRDIANEANAKSDEANQKVDGLVYDNRNLIKGTESWTDDAFYITDVYGPQNGTIDDGVLTVPINNSAIDTHFVQVTPGETYTVSIDVKSTLSAKGYTVILQYCDDDGNRLSYAYVSSEYDTDWRRISETFVIPDGATQFRLGMRSAKYKMSYRLAKMEKGSKATDWSPAPEDGVNNLRDDTNAAINVLREEVGSDIKQSAESVKIAVYDKVYLKDEVDSMVESISTEYEQTKTGWEYTFNQFKADVDDIANGNDAKFEEIKKYIRFEDGNILLGNSESPLVLKIQNDRIQFLQNGYEVAYISDRKMYNTICSVIDRLEIGDSAWQVEYNEDGDTVVSLVPIY